MGVKSNLKCSNIIWYEKWRDSVLFLYPISRGWDICVETREEIAKTYANSTEREKRTIVWLSHHDIDHLIKTFVKANPDPYVCSLPYWQEWGIVPYGY